MTLVIICATCSRNIRKNNEMSKFDFANESQTEGGGKHTCAIRLKMFESMSVNFQNFSRLKIYVYATDIRNTYSRVLVRRHARTHTRTHTHTYTYIHNRAHTYTLIHIHKYTYLHSHTYSDAIEVSTAVPA